MNIVQEVKKIDLVLNDVIIANIILPYLVVSNLFTHFVTLYNKEVINAKANAQKLGRF